MRHLNHHQLSATGTVAFDIENTPLDSLAYAWAGGILNGSSYDRHAPWEELDVCTVLTDTVFDEDLTADLRSELLETTAFAFNDRFVTSGDLRLLHLGTLNYEDLRALCPASLFPELHHGCARFPLPAPPSPYPWEPSHSCSDVRAIEERRIGLIRRLIGYLRPNPETCVEHEYLESDCRGQPTAGANTLGKYWEILSLESFHVPLEPKAVDCRRPSRGSVNIPEIPAANLRLLQSMYALDDTECRIFAFVRLAHDHPILKKAVAQREGRIREGGFRAACDVIADALSLDEDLEETYLGDFGRLIVSGLVKCRWESAGCNEPDFLKIFDCDGAPMFPSDDMSFYVRDRTKPFVPALRAPADPPALTPADFDHLGTVADFLLPLMERYLERLPEKFHEDEYYMDEKECEDACNDGYPPPNILILGPRGAGKSALVRMIADHFKVPLAEGPKLRDRVGSDTVTHALYTLTRAACDQGARILAVDDAKEIFINTRAMRAEEKATWPDERKALLERNRRHFRRVLATTRVPTFYLAESPFPLDTSEFDRYFALIVHVTCPKERIRRNAVADAFGEDLNPSCVEWLVEHDSIPLSGMDRARNLMEELDLKPEDLNPETLRSLMDAALPPETDRAALPEAALRANVAPEGYDLSFINCEDDLEDLALGLKRAGSGRVCLYGPAGTGKSAYAAHVARVIGCDLVRKNCSDLMGSNSGETEKALAKAFDEARRKKALLLIDEADSFLMDRTKTTCSWENCIVNEMLTQLDHYTGYFIATTNLQDLMDMASDRRMPLNFKFDYLRSGQALRMARRTAEALGLDPDDEALDSLKALRTLTPGDFAALRSRHKVLPLKDTGELVSRLRKICERKLKEPQAHRRIGF